jgi:1-acyl-sn-glycerol-3-phosphate acyltransferase
VGTVFALLCILYLFIREQIKLSLQAFFHPEGVQRWISVNQASISRRIFSLIRFFTGFRLEVEPRRDLSLPAVFLLVANHQSLADIPALMSAFPRHGLRFVTKRELKWGIPAVSMFLRRGKHAIISRTGDYRAGRKELAKLAVNSLKYGLSPAIFPEGTRSRSGKVQDFHSGAFRIILENAALPVLSVAIEGGYAISKLTNVFSRLWKSRYRIRPLSVYPPPGGKREILELLSVIRSEIDSQIRAWRREEAGP